MNSSKTKTSRLLLIFAAVCVACALVFGFTATSSANAQETGADAQLGAVTTSNQSVYRLYNQYTGEHFYTTNYDEMQNLKALGWNFEGEGWIAPQTSSTKVYRLYNPYAPGGDHHYTTSEEEYNALKDAGWSQEGVVFYSASADDGVAIYRWYNPYAASGIHHYTSNKDENSAIAVAGWEEEGVGFYGVKTADPDVVTMPKATLSATKATYDGEVQEKPTVSVEGLTEGTDFEVAWPSDMKNAGEKAVVVTGKGKYANCEAQTLTFTIEKSVITITNIPKQTVKEYDPDDPEETIDLTGATITGLYNNEVDIQLVAKVTPPESFPGTGSMSIINGGISGEDTLVNNYDFDASKIGTIECYVEKKKETSQTYTVTFNMGGHGDAVADQKVTSGKFATEPETDPTADGFEFTGWFSDEKCTTAFDFKNTAIEKDTTIYAGWKEVTVTTYTIGTMTLWDGLKALTTQPTTLKFTTGEQVPDSVTFKAEVQQTVESGKIGLFQSEDGATVYIAPMDESSNTPAKNDSVMYLQQYSNKFLCQAETGLTAVTTIDLSNLDTSKGTQMGYMFHDLSTLKAIEFGSHFDTSSVTDMQYMFHDCKNLTTLTLPSSFDVSEVTNMGNMFDECSSLGTLNLPSTFDVSKVTDMGYMFYNCAKLTLNCSGWNVSAVTYYQYFATGAPNVTAPTWPSA